MTTKRLADLRQRDIEACEKLAKQLNARAMQMMAWTEDENSHDFKVWETVELYSRESVKLLKEARGAPGFNQPAPTVQITTIERDPMGVPPLPEIE